MKLPVLTEENVTFLRNLAKAVLDASMVEPGQKLPGLGPNKLGIPFIRPGGRNCYPAFWTRDFVMSLESGLIEEEIAGNLFVCLAEKQANEDLYFKQGALVPKGSLPDHIRPDGLPIYFPGTYDYAEQGADEIYGRRPPYDDNFYFIECAYQTPGIPFAKYQSRLEEAFHTVPVEEEGLLVECTEETRGVNFGFMDGINHTGKLLFASLLRCLAARRLAVLFTRDGNRETAEKYEALSRKISVRIETVFAADRGLLRASTGNSCQPDVWGSAFAVYQDLVSQECRMRLSEAMTDELRRGQISWKGQICHVPLDHPGRPDSPWDCTPIPKNRYQNGAYWGTPTGWVAYTAALTDPAAADQLLSEYLEELRKDDFRQGQDFHSPWECMHPDNAPQNAVYLTSVSCPYAAVRKILEMKQPEGGDSFRP